VDRVIDVAFGENLASTMKLLKPNGVIATYASDSHLYQEGTNSRKATCEASETSQTA
jgi:NADPH:quinone reductase-like Zn-dependent oxidoreductase